MARLSDRHPLNVAGEWYVDDRCIDCDVARHHAPDLVVALADGQSVVARQPTTPDEELLMWRAALACPTRSIGTSPRRLDPPGVYPWELTPGVLMTGFNDRRSFGAYSWFVPRPDGGLLIDAPHWNREVAATIEDRGGVAHVLLSHRDDVADAQRYAEHFGARIWIHRADSDAAPFATDLIEGDGDRDVAPGVVAVPVPGHTRGSVLYLVDDRWLFTGDSFAWSEATQSLFAFRGATWYSWAALAASLGRFVASPHRFEWVFAGHGRWHGGDREDMHRALTAMVAGM